MAQVQQVEIGRVRGWNQLGLVLLHLHLLRPALAVRAALQEVDCLLGWLLNLTGTINEVDICSGARVSCILRDLPSSVAHIDYLAYVFVVVKHQDCTVLLDLGRKRDCRGTQSQSTCYPGRCSKEEGPGNGSRRQLLTDLPVS